MYPILFKIGPITIYTYGVTVALGIIAALFCTLRGARRENISSNKIVDLFFWIIMSGFIGARVVYVFTEWDYFSKQPLRIFFANEGFVFYGGFIAACLVALWYMKRRKLKVWKMADLLAPSIAIAHSIGRLGCFFYGCCYGKPTDSWVGVLFPPESPAGQSGISVIPTQIISSLALLAIFFILIAVRRYKKFNGQIFWLYVLLYAIIRFIIEFFRGDERGYIWIFSTSQFIGIFMAVIAAVMLFRLKNDAQEKF